APIADLIAAQYREQAGNYLAFFSSFDYLQKVTSVFNERYPDIPMWEQSRRMEEAEREQFLARFTPTSQGIGFAVLGGPFAEGIDLPGERLVGAFIATLGLPQLNPMNEEIRERMHAAFGAGYDYTYLYPGIQKVVQAAGRVIRTPEDRGVVYLIDDRFARSDVLRLLPAWWQVGREKRFPTDANSSA
ncbi:MAG: helicase C-terminal domain-containing protein, partial [Noviherbaspirillum sp.]